MLRFPFSLSLVALALLMCSLVLPTSAINIPPLVERAASPFTPLTPRDVGSLDQYIVSFERTISDEARAKVKEALEWEGATIVQTFDFKIFKAFLFAPASENARPLGSPENLAGWVSTLTKMDGVKGVEKDQVVNVN